MQNLVLAGVDGSPESLDAARWALTEACARRWSIRFANILPPAQVTDPQLQAAYPHAAWQAAALVFEDLQAAAKDLGVPAQCELLSGRASQVLVKLSARAGLSVVGHRNRTGLTGRLGSVSSALAAHGHCPTVVIPYDRHPHACPAYDRPAADMSRFAGEIVAAVEPGPSAAAVLRAAAEMARRHNRSLNAITVGSTTTAESGIADLLARLQAKHPGLRSSIHTLSGRPVHEITEAARDSWLLVTGTRGLSGLPGMLRGSVSQALLHHVTSPVLVISDLYSNEP